MYSPLKYLLVVILLFCFSSFSHAADLTREIGLNIDKSSEPENFFEVGLGLNAFNRSMINVDDKEDLDIGITIIGSYNWYNFFVDFANQAPDSLVFGYTAYNKENWSFDVIFTGPGSGLRKKDNQVNFEGIDERDVNTMLGGRLTGYIGENVVQLTLKQGLTSRNGGAVASALIGRNWQIRNLNFHSIFALSFRQAKLNDYYYGVSKEEAARTNFAAYDGKSSLNFDSSLGLTYPISENVLLRAEVFFGSEFGYNESPLFSKQQDFYTGISSSISYVF
ncbi:MipA/OmpV family protein [Pseudoalteromonas sp. ASV78]|uniref:MipA/OmpV family protein n=1 Tax=Pseudoalteromonas sp. ASV78 TaxID=3397851 RepID=UPI0039FC731C